MIRVGDRVRVVGEPHARGHATGTVREVDGKAYAVQFDGSREVHRWYVARELAAVRGNPGVDELLVLAALGTAALGARDGALYESFLPPYGRRR